MTDNREDLTPAADDFSAAPSFDGAGAEHREPQEARDEVGTSTTDAFAADASAPDAATASSTMYGPALPPPPPSWIPQPLPEVPAQRSRGRMKLTAGLTALVLVSGGTGGLVASAVGGGSSAAASPVAAAAALKASAQTISAA